MVYRINAQGVERLRKGRKPVLRRIKLASLVGIHPKTLEAWLKGRPVRRSNIEVLAKALEVTEKEIVHPEDWGRYCLEGGDSMAAQELNGGTNATATPRETTEDWDLIIDEHFPSWEQGKQDALMKALRVLLESDEEVRIVKKAKENSVRLRLRLTEEQAAKLERLFDTGKLKGLKVIGIMPVSEEPIVEKEEPAKYGIRVLDVKEERTGKKKRFYRKWKWPFFAANVAGLIATHIVASQFIHNLEIVLYFDSGFLGLAYTAYFTLNDYGFWETSD